MSRNWFKLFKEGCNSDFLDYLRKINHSWWLGQNHSPEFARLLGQFWHLTGPTKWVLTGGFANWFFWIILGTVDSFLFSRDLRNMHLNFSIIHLQIHLLLRLKIGPVSSEIIICGCFEFINHFRWVTLHYM